MSGYQGMAMRFLLTLITITAPALFTTGCDSGHGPDSLYNPKHRPGATISSCTQCHSSAKSPSLDPLVTNGSGTYGKHIKHVQERGILCERCHDGYYPAPTHMDGTFDRGDPAVNLVNLDIVGPSGTWTAGIGRCSGVACHGSDAPDWYSTNTWSLPACTTCHDAGFSSALDPVTTNGMPPAGRHGKHVTSRGIACERCHYQYPTRLTHMNGMLDTTDPAVTPVLFNIVGTSGSWTGDTGAGTGQCADIACHGTDTLSWYGSSTWSLPVLCTTCHAASYSSALDPLLTNGSGLAGKHGKHVTSYNFACTKCHENYPSRTSHASGMLDTQDPSILLVWFDATNPTGTWVNDTGPETGACSSLFCHGTETPEWYGLAGVTPPTNCVICHSNPVASRRQVLGANGDFGANPNMLSHHVNPGPGSDPTSTQCAVCHEMSEHMGGTVRLRNADTGSAISYSASLPGTLEPFCLSCHDADGANGNKSPFADGRTLGTVPNMAGDKIAGYWNAASTLHKDNGLTCAGAGAPNTGCHGSGQSINMHGSVSKGLLARNLTLPATNDVYIENDYQLCFDCHASYQRVGKEQVLGVKLSGALYCDYGPGFDYPPYSLAATATLFRDQNNRGTGKLYDDPPNFWLWGCDSVNLHWFHTALVVWNYRGTYSNNGGMSCTACHNVHGTESPQGMTYAEMGYRHWAGTVAGDWYGKMDASVPYTLDRYPTSCAMNCHDSSSWGQTYNWYEPLFE